MKTRKESRLSLVLDDWERLNSIDKDGMCTLLEKFPEHCEDAIKRANKLTIPKKVRISGKLSYKFMKPDKIVIVGMGGSAIGGNLLKDWLRSTLHMPIEVCRQYTLPAYVDNHTLVLAVSYSGNTEETLSCFVEAIEKRCMIIAISSDGVLQEFSERVGIPFIKLPKDYPPRSALAYLFFSLVVSLYKLKMLSSLYEEVDEVITILKEIKEIIKPANPIINNPAKKLALSIQKSIPLIAGFGFYESVALRMKTQFNENSKTPAKVELFPELTHNEVAGWTGLLELTKNFSVILIRDEKEPQEIRTRIEATKELVFNKRAAKVVEIWSKGRGKLAKMFSIMYMGDFTSFYLAILYGFNPTPVAIIEQLKGRLNEKVNTIDRLRKTFEALLDN